MASTKPTRLLGVQVPAEVTKWLFLFLVLHVMVAQYNLTSGIDVCPPKKFGQYCADCYCNWNNAESCSPIDGACTCKGGYTGPSCEDDVNECFEMTGVCPGMACNNLKGTYECVCPPGFFYSSVNYLCLPCHTNTYGFNCSKTCDCNPDNTMFCDIAHGDCLCKDGWEGELCGLSINDCLPVNDCPGDTCEDRHMGYVCICGEGLMHIGGKCQPFDVVMISFNDTPAVGEFVDIYIMYHLPRDYFTALATSPNIQFTITDDQSDSSCLTDFKKQSRPVLSTDLQLRQISKRANYFDYYTMLRWRFLEAGMLTVKAYNSRVLHKTLYKTFSVRYNSKMASDCLRGIEIKDTEPLKLNKADTYVRKRQSFIKLEIKTHEEPSCTELPRVIWEYLTINRKQNNSLCLDPIYIEKMDVDKLITDNGNLPISDHQEMAEYIPVGTFPLGTLMIYVTAYVQRTLATKVGVVGFTTIERSWIIRGITEPTSERFLWKPQLGLRIKTDFHEVDTDAKLNYYWECASPASGCRQLAFDKRNSFLMVFNFVSGTTYQLVLNVSVRVKPTSFITRKFAVEVVWNVNDVPITMTCIKSCQGYVAKTDEVIINARTHGDGIFAVIWTIEEKKKNSTDPATEIPWLVVKDNYRVRSFNNYAFKSRPNVFKPGFIYTIFCTATDRDRGSRTGTTSRSFETEDYPQGKGCTVKPPSGRASFTRFTVHCIDYVDVSNHLPLTYRLFQYEPLNSKQSDKGFRWKLLAYSNTGMMKSVAVSSLHGDGQVKLKVTISTVKQTAVDVEVRIKIETGDQKEDLKRVEDDVKHVGKAGNQDDLPWWLRWAGGRYEGAKYQGYHMAVVVSTGDRYEEVTVKAEDLRSIKNAATTMGTDGSATFAMKKKVRGKLLRRLSDFESTGVDLIEHSSAVLSEVVAHDNEIPVATGLGHGLDTTERVTKYLGKTGRGSFKATEDVAGMQVTAMSDLLSVSSDYGKLLVNTQSKRQKADYVKEGKENAKKTMKSISQITNVLRAQFDKSSAPMKIKKENLEILLQTMDIKRTRQIDLSPTDGRVAFSLPSAHLDTIGDGQVEAEFNVFDKSPFSWSADRVHGDLPVVRVDFKEPSVERRNVEMQRQISSKSFRFSEPADILIKNKNPDNDSIEYPMLVFVDDISNTVIMSSCIFISTLASSEETTVVKIKSNDGLIITAKAMYTDAEAAFEQFTDYNMIEFPLDTSQIPEIRKNKYTLSRQKDLLFLPALTQRQLKDGIPYYKVKLKVMAQQILSSDFDHSNEVSEAAAKEIATKVNSTVNMERMKIYNITISVTPFKLSCIHFDDDDAEFQTDACQLSSYTKISVLHCMCTIAASFSASFLMVPRFIDPLDLALFGNVFANPLAVSFVIALWMTFIALLVWGRRKDKEDESKRGATILTDNKDTHTYVYLICTVTGNSLRGSTTSNVYIIVRGSWYQSDVHNLSDPTRATFTAGAENWFVMTTETDLGNVKSVTIWTDYSGGNPSWFLDSVYVQNLTTGESWTCRFNAWLSASQGSNQVLAEIPAVLNVSMTGNWMAKITNKGRHDIRNDHLWFGMVYKTSYNKFTRVRRLATGFTILHALMLLNLMLFGVVNVDDSRQFMQVFGYNFHVTSIFVTLITTAMSSTLGFVLVFMLNRSRPRPKNKEDKKEKKGKKKGESKTEDEIEEEEGMNEAEESDESMDEGYEKSKNQQSFARFLGKDINEFNEEEKELFEKLHEAQNKMQGAVESQAPPKQFTLPWYYLYVFWVFVVVFNVFSAYFVMLYGLELGYNKSVEWLFTFFAGFLMNIFVVQPFKVAGMVMLLVLVFKQTHSLKEQAPFARLNDSIKAIKEQQNIRRSAKLFMHTKYQPPPSAGTMKGVWKRLKIEMEAREMLRDLVVYSFYMLIILLTTNSHFSVTKTFAQTRGFEKILFSSDLQDQVKTVSDMWKFMMDDVVSFLHGSKKAFIQMDNYISVGSVRIRQVRVKKDENSCRFVPSAMMSEYRRALCVFSLPEGEEETQSYNGSWTRTLPPGEEGDSESPYTYQTKHELKTYSITGEITTYPGGGYTVIVQTSGDSNAAINSIQKIAKSSWIDQYTRCIFLEFTTYNADENLFTNFIIGFEFFNYGGPLPFKLLRTSRLYHYDRGTKRFVQVVEAILAVCTAFHLVIIVNTARKDGLAAFCLSPWKLLDVSIVVLIISVAVFAYLRLTTLESILAIFVKYGNNHFLDFQDAFDKNDKLLVTEGLLSGFAILKLVYIFRFNPFYNTFFKSLTVSTQDMMGVTIMTILYAVAFALAGLFIFGRLMYSYNSLYRCLLTLLFFMMGEADYEGIEAANRIMGPIYFLIALMVTQYIVINFFASMIRDGLDIARCLEYGRVNIRLICMMNTLKTYFGQKIETILED